MGCATMREKIESQIMILKIERAEIGKEREEKIKQYEEITGEKIYRKPIPDYLILSDNTKDTSKDNSIKNTKKRRSSSKKSLSDRQYVHNSRIASSRTKISSSRKSLNDSDYNIKKIKINKRKNVAKKYYKKNQRINEESESDSESDDERIHSNKRIRKRRY
jgi:hypothetical protein